MYLESKRTESESPTEYNVNVLKLASREIMSSPVVKKATLAAETPLDSPAKNTRRAGRKRYYEKLDHDEDSEEEFKPHLEQDASSNDEGTDGLVDTIHLLQDLPAEGSGHNMNLRVQKMQKKFKLLE